MKLTKKEIELQLIGAREELQAKQSTVDYLETELQALPKVPERWRAEWGKDYFFVGYSGRVINAAETHRDSEHECHATGNYFQTRDEAERIAKVQLAYRTLHLAMKNLQSGNHVIMLVAKTKELQVFHDDRCISNPLPKLIAGSARLILNTYPNELRTFLTGGSE